MGKYFANKGAILARFCANNAPLCVAACHFDAGISLKSQAKRKF